jgi:hypothetical protein
MEPDRVYSPDMPLLSLPEFASALPVTGALIGIDPGSKTIGLSVLRHAARHRKPCGTGGQEEVRD